MKKIISVLLIIIFGLALVGGGIWYLFFYERTEEIINDEENTAFINNFFPIETFSQGGSENENVFFDENEPNVPVLRQISQTPVAGYTIFSEKIKKTITQTDEEGNEVETETEEEIVKFRYVERANSHVYETTATSPQKTRLSNTTIPKISEVIFSENPDKFTLRFIDSGDDIKTYSVELIKTSTSTASSTEPEDDTTTPYSIIGDFGPLNINNIFTYGFNQAYSLWNGTGYSIIRKTPNSQETVYQFPIDIWNIEPVSESLVALNSKPSFELLGSLYLLNTNSGNLQKIISDRSGLTSTVNPSGELVIYSQSISNSINTLSYDVNDGFEIALDFLTLPEKCVWSKIDNGLAFCAVPSTIPRADYPDDWYKGLVSFSDNIIKFDAVSGQHTELLKATQQGLDLDITNIQLSPDEKYIGFINKKDLTLWSYRIKEN